MYSLKYEEAEIALRKYLSSGVHQPNEDFGTQDSLYIYRNVYKLASRHIYIYGNVIKLAPR